MQTTALSRIRLRLTGAANGSYSSLRVSPSSLPSQRDGGSRSGRGNALVRISTYYQTTLYSLFLIRGIGVNTVAHGLSLPDREHEKQHVLGRSRYGNAVSIHNERRKTPKHQSLFERKDRRS